MSSHVPLPPLASIRSYIYANAVHQQSHVFRTEEKSTNVTAAPPTVQLQIKYSSNEHGPAQEQKREIFNFTRSTQFLRRIIK